MIVYIANESYDDILRSMGVRKYKITLSRLAKSGGIGSLGLQP